MAEADARLDSLAASGRLSPALLLVMAKAHAAAKESPFTQEETKDVMAHLYIKARPLPHYHKGVDLMARRACLSGGPANPALGALLACGAWTAVRSRMRPRQEVGDSNMWRGSRTRCDQPAQDASQD